MPIPVVKFDFEGETIYSPFTGGLAYNEDQVADPSLLFFHMGQIGDYGFLSDTLKTAATAAGISDLERQDPMELLTKLDIPGAVAFHVNGGWNGMSTYCFAPIEDEG
jgi:hypothetical protein